MLHPCHAIWICDQPASDLHCYRLFDCRSGFLSSYLVGSSCCLLGRASYVDSALLRGPLLATSALGPCKAEQQGHMTQMPGQPFTMLAMLSAFQILMGMPLRTPSTSQHLKPPLPWMPKPSKMSLSSLEVVHQNQPRMQQLPLLIFQGH
jgi:hypothetical protein